MFFRMVRVPLLIHNRNVSVLVVLHPMQHLVLHVWVCVHIYLCGYIYIIYIYNIYNSRLIVLLFLCHLESNIEPIQQILNFSYYIFQFYNFNLILLYIFYLLEEHFYFSICSRQFIIACWSICMIAALWYNSNICQLALSFPTQVVSCCFFWRANWIVSRVFWILCYEILGLIEVL